MAANGRSRTCCAVLPSQSMWHWDDLRRVEHDAFLTTVAQVAVRPFKGCRTPPCFSLAAYESDPAPNRRADHQLQATVGPRLAMQALFALQAQGIRWAERRIDAPPVCRTAAHGKHTACPRGRRTGHDEAMLDDTGNVLPTRPVECGARLDEAVHDLADRFHVAFPGHTCGPESFEGHRG